MVNKVKGDRAIIRVAKYHECIVTLAYFSQNNLILETNAIIYEEDNATWNGSLSH